MHDLRLIRENPEMFDAALATRGVEPQAAMKMAAKASAGAPTARPRRPALRSIVLVMLGWNSQK